MKEYQDLLDKFVKGSCKILGDNLVGIYLHGSAVMRCFNPDKSDIDLLVVVKEEISREAKKSYMDMIVELNKQAPQKGIEMSIVKECVCNPFVYPTPFELHFSIAHLEWYIANPEDYVEKMNGTDKDLAAHATILYHRGQTLYGKEIREVFGEASREDYLDSIWADIAEAKEEIMDNPMYITLNLCRVLAYCREGLIVSKQEGGEWGLKHMPMPEYRSLITEALEEYQSGKAMNPDEKTAIAFAEYMLEEIKGEEYATEI